MHKYLKTSVVVIATVLLSVFLHGAAMAGTKDLEATRRDKYNEKGTESLIEVMDRKDAEEKEYRNKMMVNSDEIIALLKEIKLELVKLNAKKQ